MDINERKTLGKMAEKKQRLIIGITGGIASGKSEIRRILESLGCFGIDADQIGHELMQNGRPVFNAIVARYGKPVLDSADEFELASINRSHLADIVFSDTAELKWLESITHPLIVSRIEAMIKMTDRSIAIEAVKLMTSGLSGLCDQKWLALSDENLQIRRLMERRGFSYITALYRVDVQKNIDWKKKEIDAIIDTEVPLYKLREKVKSLWGELGEKYLDD